MALENFLIPCKWETGLCKAHFEGCLTDSSLSGFTLRPLGLNWISLVWFMHQRLDHGRRENGLPIVWIFVSFEAHPLLIWSSQYFYIAQKVCQSNCVVHQDNRTLELLILHCTSRQILICLTGGYCKDKTNDEKPLINWKWRHTSRDQTLKPQVSIRCNLAQSNCSRKKLINKPIKIRNLRDTTMDNFTSLKGDVKQGISFYRDEVKAEEVISLPVDVANFMQLRNSAFLFI